MKRWKQMTALILALLMLMMTAAGCAQEVVETRGMELRAAFVNRPATLDPVYASTEEERTITEHLFENLMKYTAAGLVNGQAAEYTVTTNEDGTETYTSTLGSALLPRRWPRPTPLFWRWWRGMMRPSRATWMLCRYLRPTAVPLR